MMEQGIGKGYRGLDKRYGMEVDEKRATFKTKSLIGVSRQVQSKVN